MDNTGSVMLRYLNDVTEEFEFVTTGDKSVSNEQVDSCKSRHDVAYTLTLDMTFNGTNFRCETSPAFNSSEERIINIVPGEFILKINSLIDSFYNSTCRNKVYKKG